ncbi:uncharacterized protein SEPMUDRAFT_115765 [Sphaerulina musiva SO2202]|uniref:Uncharacterized protein n=1 Tax=Sphaerulina musiva (strain SO2202) TaxID=692275 RepID=M3D8N9_SPHMS|nr:uncharacterized protein SEPMUDRAFT_115765 [Sphaerulina musiva SO2202]EMF14495.1 hypothetical protein SEPMUDRAFT_115765 [Sphaerulina musiva SO2202]
MTDPAISTRSTGLTKSQHERPFAPDIIPQGNLLGVDAESRRSMEVALMRAIAPGDHSARDSALWSLHQHGPLQAHARTSWPVEEENDVALTRRTRMG